MISAVQKSDVSQRGRKRQEQLVALQHCQAHEPQAQPLGSEAHHDGPHHDGPRYQPHW